MGPRRKTVKDIVKTSKDIFRNNGVMGNPEPSSAKINMDLSREGATT